MFACLPVYLFICLFIIWKWLYKLSMKTLLQLQMFYFAFFFFFNRRNSLGGVCVCGGGIQWLVVSSAAFLAQINAARQTY